MTARLISAVVINAGLINAVVTVVPIEARIAG
jgi:hypothetical protein